MIGRPKQRLVHNGEYNDLTVVGVGEPYIAPGSGKVYQTSICKCVCGSIDTYINSHVRSGKKPNCRLCGTQRLKNSLIGNTRSNTHSMSYTIEYRCWRHMIERCVNPGHISYKDYGGRGITVCNSWLDSFENFFADMGYRPIGDYNIEREENDGNYEPTNCKWATRVEQNNNKRNNKCNQP